VESYGIKARPSNWLGPVILLTLREWNSYGYELMKRSAAFGFKAMNPATLYRTLRQSILRSTRHKVTENTQFGRSSTLGGLYWTWYRQIAYICGVKAVPTEYVGAAFSI
jgi:Transcriptional regulator PadR-like family